MLNLAMMLHFQKYATYSANEVKKIEAANAERERERESNIRNLARLCDEYSLDVFGDMVFSPCLLLYAAFAGEFKEGWIPSCFYEQLAAPQLSRGYNGFASAASMIPRIFTLPDGCKVPNIATFANGLFLSPESEIIPLEDLSGYIFTRCDKAVFKQDSSMRGQGIHFFTEETFTLEKIHALGNGCFQSFINQHKTFEELEPNSVATLRLLTVVDDDGNVSCRSAYLRVSGQSDETHVKSATALRISVDLTTGQLSEHAYFPDYRTTRQHPDTGAVFAEKRVPKFNKCLDIVLNLHKQFRECRIVGWDVIVDKDENLQIIEWNARCPIIIFPEQTQGPCFKDLNWERFLPS